MLENNVNLAFGGGQLDEYKYIVNKNIIASNSR